MNVTMCVTIQQKEIPIVPQHAHVTEYYLSDISVPLFLKIVVELLDLFVSWANRCLGS